MHYTNPPTVLSTRDKRIILAQMIRGQRKAKRTIKMRDRIEEIEEGLTAAQILQAIALDERLAKQERAEAATQQGQNNYQNPQQAIAATPAASNEAVTMQNVFDGAGKPLSAKQRKKLAQRAAALAGSSIK